MSRQNSNNVVRWAVVLGLGWLLGGCGLAARRPWVQIAEQATGDGLSADTAVRFDPMPGDPLMFVRAEWSWLDAHGYARNYDKQVRNTFGGTKALHFVYVWPVRDADGREQEIFFERGRMTGAPMAGRKL